MNDRLWTLYDTVCQEELRSLEEFVRRLFAGEWGPFPAEDVLALLHELEGRVLANIEVKAGEGPRYAEQADEAAERTRQEFADLVALVERASAGR